jgi:hypothetical protein
VHDRHYVEKRERAVPLERQVEEFVATMFQEGDLNHDGYLTVEEFMEWGLRNDMVLRLLAGTSVHDVRLCEEEEYVVVENRDMVWEEELGIVPASEL